VGVRYHAVSGKITEGMDTFNKRGKIKILKTTRSKI